LIHNSLEKYNFNQKNPPQRKISPRSKKALQRAPSKAAKSQLFNLTLI